MQKYGYRELKRRLGLQGFAARSARNHHRKHRFRIFAYFGRKLNENATKTKILVIHM